MLPEPSFVRSLVTEARTLPGLDEKSERLDRLVADYTRSVTRGQGALVVALVGATGAGKSTLLNALAGTSLAIEGVHRPTSREAVVYAPEDADLGELEVRGTRVSRYVPDAGAWSGQVFVDTPDLNSIAAEHRDEARRVLEQADVALVVMHRGSVAEAVQADFLAGFAARRRIVFVLNFADELGPAARAELTAQVRRIARERLGLPEEETRVFAVSARAARAGQDPSGQWGAFLEELRALGTRGVAERVRRSNATAVLRELVELIDGARVRTEGTLEEIAGALDRGLDDAAQTLQREFSERLRTAHGHLAAEVRRQASGRWWGPAAWWMRMSFVGAGGLGAAALVARRSLPIGLAVAATSTVLDRVATHTRGSATTEKVVSAGQEETGDVARAGRKALSEARSRALSLGLSPERVRLPDTGTLLEALSTLRASAWAETEGPGIAAAVARWWRWARFILLPLVNLPLLALLGHVGYRVVRAYLEETYLGVDYYLNAGALAAVLSVVGGLLASLSLVGAAKSAAAQGVHRFEDGLGAMREDWVGAVRGAFAEPRRAAQRLKDAQAEDA